MSEPIQQAVEVVGPATPVLAVIVSLVLLPIVTELVKGAAHRWRWFDPASLGVPITGVASLALYTLAWWFWSGDTAELLHWWETALAVAFGASGLHSLGGRIAPQATKRMSGTIRRVTGTTTAVDDEAGE
jgi:hypothetical protein